MIRRSVRSAAVLLSAVLALAGTAEAHEERDLVCGMLVDVDTAEFVLDHEGKRYYFCNAADLETFRADPDAYAGALRLSREANGRTYECAIRPREPKAPGVATIVFSSATGALDAAEVVVDVFFVDRARAPEPRRMRLVPLPESGGKTGLGLKLALDAPGETRLLLRNGGDLVAFGFTAVPGVVEHEPALRHAIETGGREKVSMEAQHRSMAEIGELWTGVAKGLLASDPPDLEAAKEPLARIRALARLMRGFELHHFPEAKDEMLAEAAVFESAIVSLLTSVAKERADEARERFRIVDAMSCTRCHLKFRFGAIDDVSRFPDLREAPAAAVTSKAEASER